MVLQWCLKHGLVVRKSVSFAPPLLCPPLTSLITSAPPRQEHSTQGIYYTNAMQQYKLLTSQDALEVMFKTHRVNDG